MSDERTSSVDLKAWLILTFLALMWGSSYILIKKAVAFFPPLQVGSMRIVISALAFLPFLFFQWKKINWKKWHWLLIVGLAGSGIPAFLFPIAQTRISSALAGMMSSTTPVCTLILGVLFFGFRFRKSQGLGVVLGMLGASVLAILGSDLGGENNLFYILLLILAALLYATSANTVGAHLRDMGSIAISTVSFVMIGPPALIYLMTTDIAERLQMPGATAALGYVSLLALGSTVIASILFFALVKRTDAVFSSSVSYLMPIIALSWGVLDGESMTFWHIIGMVLVLGGVYLSKR